MTARLATRLASVLVAACAVALIGLVGMTAGVAKAHASLVASDPAAGSVLPAAPTEITLTFNEPVSVGLGGIRVFDGRGTEIEVGQTRQTSATVVAATAPTLADGSYVVDWQVISADSHPAHGAFTFQVGEVSDLDAGVLDAVVNRDTTDRTAQIALGVARGVVVAAMALLIGAFVGVLLGAAPATARLGAAVRIAAVVGGAAGLLSVGLEAGYVSGDGVGAVADPDAWRAVLDTRLGVAWVARATVVLLSGVILAPLAAIPTTRLRGAGGQLAVAVSIASMSLASAFGGHGATGRWELVGIAATIAHVAGMGAWIGGLGALLIGFSAANADHIRRFSRVALAAALVVVGSGALQSARQIDGMDALTGTTYGKLAIAKALAVVAVLVVAALSRHATHGSIVGSRRRAVAPARAVGADALPPPIEGPAPIDRPVLRRAVGLEVAIAAVVIALTSALMGANPTATATSGAFSASLVQSDYLLTVTVDPARAGLNEVHLYLSSPLGTLDQAKEVTLRIGNAERDVAPIVVPLLQIGAGHYQALETPIPFAGLWQLEVVARFGEFDLVSFRTTLDVSA